MQYEKDMLDPKTPLSNSRAWGRLDDKVADYAEEIRDSPATDVTARGLENVTVIKKWAIMNKNIKGTIQKEVSEAACYLQAAVTALAAASMETAMPNREEGESEVEALQRQNRILRSEILALKAETKRLKEGGGIVAGRRPRRAPSKALPTGEPQPTAATVPLPEEAMEVVVGCAEPAPVARPPIKGTSKRLDREYPPKSKQRRTV